MKNFLKGKIKNKFIVSIVLIIGIIIGVQWYISRAGVDTNSYVVLVKGEVSINENILGSEDRKILAVGDEIITKQDSICVIEWGDGSLTRLGENGKIEIQELNVEEDLSKINLQFKLTEGKTWSNIVSFLGEKSYFKQNFEDIEASVRGTVFDVNLKTNVLFVENHEVMLEKGEQKKVIKEGTAFNFKTFSLVSIQKFLNNIRDKAWEEFNSDGDRKYFEKLKADLLRDISAGEISMIITNDLSEKYKNLKGIKSELFDLTGEKRVDVYYSLLEQYQKLNFIGPDDGELFTTKNEIKKLLISNAGEEDKRSLLQYSVYDLKDAIDSKNIDAIKGTVSLIGENKDILKNLNIDVLSGLTSIPDGLKGALEGHLDTATELFKNTPKFNIELDDLQGKAGEIFNEGKSVVEGILNKFNK